MSGDMARLDFRIVQLNTFDPRSSRMRYEAMIGLGGIHLIVVIDYSFQLGQAVWLIKSFNSDIHTS
jgi:hypothetical protein